jgi:hypothetical protein
MNAIAALIDALQSPENFYAAWIDGELVIEPRAADGERTVVSTSSALPAVALPSASAHGRARVMVERSAGLPIAA